jgi:hypothetical protein
VRDACRSLCPSRACTSRTHSNWLINADRAFIAACEAEPGEITDEQVEATYQRAKARAVVVRGDDVVDDKRVPRESAST